LVFGRACNEVVVVDAPGSVGIAYSFRIATAGGARFLPTPAISGTLEISLVNGSWELQLTADAFPSLQVEQSRNGSTRVLLRQQESTYPIPSLFSPFRKSYAVPLGLSKTGSKSGVTR